MENCNSSATSSNSPGHINPLSKKMWDFQRKRSMGLWKSPGELVMVQDGYSIAQYLQLKLCGIWDPTQFILDFYMRTLKGEQLGWMDTAGSLIAHSTVL